MAVINLNVSPHAVVLTVSFYPSRCRNIWWLFNFRVLLLMPTILLNLFSECRDAESSLYTEEALRQEGSHFSSSWRAKDRKSVIWTTSLKEVVATLRPSKLESPLGYQWWKISGYMTGNNSCSFLKKRPPIKRHLSAVHSGTILNIS